VWFPVPPLGYGGIEIVVSLLTTGFVAEGHDVTLFASGGSGARPHRLALAEPPDPRKLGDPWYDAYHALSAYLPRRRVRRDPTITRRRRARARRAPGAAGHP